MKIKALTNFAGTVTMCKGEVRECSEESVVADLISAGYVEPVKEKKNQKGKPKGEQEEAEDESQ